MVVPQIRDFAKNRVLLRKSCQTFVRREDAGFGPAASQIRSSKDVQPIHAFAGFEPLIDLGASATCRPGHTRGLTKNFQPNFGTTSRGLARLVGRAAEDYRLPVRLRLANRDRIRSLDSELQPESLPESCTQGGTQSIPNPDFARVVTAWPALTPALKAAILAIIDSELCNMDP